jgi:hypothetical protein
MSEARADGDDAVLNARDVVIGKIVVFDCTIYLLLPGYNEGNKTFLANRYTFSYKMPGNPYYW